MSSRVAFIGLGNMGRPMAMHLLRAGHSLSVFSRRPESAQSLVEAGATYCSSPAEAARGSDFICINVTDTADVEQVIFGNGPGGSGVADGAKPGAIVMDFSTISASATREFARRLGDLGIKMLDCPVSGGVRGAQAASLTIMVGGKAGDLAMAKPLLDCLGQSVIHIGDHGAGQVVKACNQMVQVINIAGIAEAMHFAGQQGIDPGKMLAALQGGMAASRMLDLMGPKMMSRDFSAGIESRLHHKDFGLIAEQVQALELTLPMVRAAATQLEVLIEAGGGGLDTSALLTVLDSKL